ncbi:uncharacterized protein LOC106478346 [Limulus polyphemus]|uniref:Uncharacterized protein LOC106478346 n=1 Tax=Limulus polyphemus TaxID=6850 RepID=A0ABM1C543_LIMPO|nr:uncharacterized protein LOC106478346 [Limulus polyphemus]
MKVFIVLATLLASLTVLAEDQSPGQTNIPYNDDEVEIIEVNEEDHDVEKERHINEIGDFIPISSRESRLLPTFLDSYGRQIPPSAPFLQTSVIGSVAFLGLMGLGTMALLYPILSSLEAEDLEKFNEIDLRDAGGFFSKSLTGISERVMTYVEQTLEELPSIPRLDAQECMKRSVCEAHNQPKKYGVIGILLQLFFPPYLETEEPLKVVSKYQLAARYGRQDRANCGKQYDGCMISFLDLIQAIVNAFIK